MAKGELFDISDITARGSPLTKEKREAAVWEIIRKAKLRVKYFYTLREARGILRRSYDELLTLITKYRLDAVFFLSAKRIPWWDLAGFMLDDDDLTVTRYLKANHNLVSQNSMPSSADPGPLSQTTPRP